MTSSPNNLQEGGEGLGMAQGHGGGIASDGMGSETSGDNNVIQVNLLQ